MSDFRRFLFVSILITFPLDFLLTPLGGLETRSLSDVRIAGVVALSLFFVGVGSNVGSIVLLRSKPRRASIFAAIGSILYFPIFVADQTGLFSPRGIPPGIFVLEYVAGAVGIVTLYFAFRVHSSTSAERSQL